MEKKVLNYGGNIKIKTGNEKWILRYAGIYIK